VVKKQLDHAHLSIQCCQVKECSTSDFVFRPNSSVPGEQHGRYAQPTVYNGILNRFKITGIISVSFQML
jgi:hypothetical protein